MTGRIYAGTASWTDPTLVKGSDWYPKRSMSAEERLRYYASIFTAVEVDATYYYPPTEHLAGLWVERTPADFRMNVKAYGLLTGHPVARRSVWPDVAEALPAEETGNVYLEHLPPEAVELAFSRFHTALAPLYSAGKLGAVLFQFPPWFTARKENRELLRGLGERLPDYPIAVEFRHASWMEDDQAEQRTLGLLEEAGLAYVSVDEPQGFSSSVRPVVAATAELAVVRFHGQNTDNWNKQGISAAERFRYLYTEDELRRWVDPVRRLADETQETHVIMNNCYADYGVRNARQLAELLEEGLQPDAPAAQAVMDLPSEQES